MVAPLAKQDASEHSVTLYECCSTASPLALEGPKCVQ